MPESSPRVLAGRYEIRYRIGASAATEVFLARDRQLDRDVAVKTLSAGFARDPQVQDRFRRMAAAASPLRDPNLAAVFDVGESDDGPFLVMEHVDGASLADTMRDSPLGLDRVTEIGAGVASGLAAAHRSGVVHGSLMPRDVLLGRDGSVKLTDFGAASAGLAGMSESPVEAAIYSAPERLQGGPADASGDLYALGVMLHEAATGSPPFSGADAVAITRDKLDRAPLPPSATTATIPPAFDAVVERLTSPTLARRYHSADEVANDLRRLHEPAAPTKPLPVVASAPLRTESATTLPPRKSNTGWIVAAILLVAVVGALVAWLLLRDDSSTPQVEVPRVVGQQVLDAQRMLTDAGFRPSVVNQANPSAEPGIVFDQSPPGASLADEGSEVQLSVSTGPPPTSSTTTTTTTTTTTSTTSTTTTTTTPPTSTPPTS